MAPNHHEFNTLSLEALETTFYNACVYGDWETVDNLLDLLLSPIVRSASPVSSSADKDQNHYAPITSTVMPFPSAESDGSSKPQKINLSHFLRDNNGVALANTAFIQAIERRMDNKRVLNRAKRSIKEFFEGNRYIFSGEFPEQIDSSLYMTYVSAIDRAAYGDLALLKEFQQKLSALTESPQASHAEHYLNQLIELISTRENLKNVTEKLFELLQRQTYPHSFSIDSDPVISNRETTIFNAGENPAIAEAKKIAKYDLFDLINTSFKSIDSPTGKTHPFIKLQLSTWKRFLDDGMAAEIMNWSFFPSFKDCISKKARDHRDAVKADPEMKRLREIIEALQRFPSNQNDDTFEDFEARFQEALEKNQQTEVDYLVSTGRVKSLTLRFEEQERIVTQARDIINNICMQLSDLTTSAQTEKKLINQMHLWNKWLSPEKSLFSFFTKRPDGMSEVAESFKKDLLADPEISELIKVFQNILALQDKNNQRISPLLVAIRMACLTNKDDPDTKIITQILTDKNFDVTRAGMGDFIIQKTCEIPQKIKLLIIEHLNKLSIAASAEKLNILNKWKANIILHAFSDLSFDRNNINELLNAANQNKELLWQIVHQVSRGFLPKEEREKSLVLIKILFERLDELKEPQENYSQKINKALFYAVSVYNAKLVDFFISKGADINQKVGASQESLLIFLLKRLNYHQYKYFEESDVSQQLRRKHLENFSNAAFVLMDHLQNAEISLEEWPEFFKLRTLITQTINISQDLSMYDLSLEDNNNIRAMFVGKGLRQLKCIEENVESRIIKHAITTMQNIADQFKKSPDEQTKAPLKTQMHVWNKWLSSNNRFSNFIVSRPTGISETAKFFIDSLRKHKEIQALQEEFQGILTPQITAHQTNRVAELLPSYPDDSVLPPPYPGISRTELSPVSSSKKNLADALLNRATQDAQAELAMQGLNTIGLTNMTLSNPITSNHNIPLAPTHEAPLPPISTSSNNSLSFFNTEESLRENSILKALSSQFLTPPSTTHRPLPNTPTSRNSSTLQPLS